MRGQAALHRTIYRAASHLHTAGLGDVVQQGWQQDGAVRSPGTGFARASLPMIASKTTTPGATGGSSASALQQVRLGLLYAYYQSTRLQRSYRLRRASAAGQAPVMVLFYHRVADDALNDWTCPFRTFARQMRWLKRRFDMVSLAEAQRRLASGCNRRPAVSITFDDGYADNCRRAIPLLLRERIPCTYFVSSRFILHGEPFPHDVAVGRPLRPNTASELRAMAGSGIEIGGHTRSHANLGAIADENRLADELVGGNLELQEVLGRPIRYFAFPYGLHANLSAAAMAIARRSGVEGVCSAYGAYNLPGDDPFHLQRIHGDLQMARFYNWMSVDPRKLHVPRFEATASSTQHSDSTAASTARSAPATPTGPGPWTLAPGPSAESACR